MQTPPKPNYQRELEQTLSTIPAGTKPHLFLHACCAPCSSYVLEYLSRYFTITIYFYNPNIMPEAEFSHRLAELRRLLQEMPLEGTVSVVAGTWEPERFLALAKGHEHEPERGERCQRCIRLRLEQTMQAAKDLGYQTIAVAGGVSANSGVRSAMAAACEKQGCKLFVPPLSLCGDNGAMIACAGSYAYAAGVRADASLNAYATMSLEHPTF